MAKRIRIPGILQTRAAFEPASFDAEKGTVEVTWTTGARGLRRSFDGPYYEELEVSDKAVDLSRMNNGASVLNAHAGMDVHDVIGVVERAWLAGNEGRALIRFSDREEVQPIRADVKNGILRHISVGYSVQKYEKVEEAADGAPVLRATRWTPAEISIVPIAFDDGAMVRGRTEDSHEVEVESSAAHERLERDMTEKQSEAVAAAAASPEGKANTAEMAARAAAEERARRAGDDAARIAREREEAAQAERTRVSEISKLVARTNLGNALAEKFISDGVTVEEARAALFEHVVARDEATPTNSYGLRVSAGEDARDKFVRGASAALFERCGVAGILAQAKQKDPEKFKDVSFDGGEFRGMSVKELARESLERRGIKVRGLSPMEMVGLAFTYRMGDGHSYQTTSDFTVLLENVLYKSLLGAYAVTPDTWSEFCKVDTVADFRASNRFRTGSISVLDSVDEHGEFKNKVIPDGQKTSISVSTKGNIIALSRQTIINDDMGALADVAAKLGRAARLSIETDVYALLAANSGLGATFGAQAFFHSVNSNINSTASGITVAGINADYAVLAAQKDISSNEYLDLRPEVLLVPISLRGEASVINESQYDPADSKFQKPNYCRGLFSKVIGTPRLTGTRRYMFADRNVAPAIVVAFLEGQGQAPVLDSENGWRVDGVEWKVRLDYKAQFFDPKGAVTNAGQ